MTSIRKQEEKCFLRAFCTYMVPFIRNSKEQKVILKKDASLTVYFEFYEENGVTTIRNFPDDLIFAYNIAVDAICNEAKSGNSDFSIQEGENSATVTLIRN